MNERETVALDADQMAMIRAILAISLPQGVRVLVFGSRATGRARPYSDLDLALDAGRPLSLDEQARLAEAFSESDLPFRVDLVDLSLISETFRALIEAECVPLTQGKENEARLDRAGIIP